jgi:hypothetical protein
VKDNVIPMGKTRRPVIVNYSTKNLSDEVVGQFSRISGIEDQSGARRRLSRTLARAMFEQHLAGKVDVWSAKGAALDGRTVLYRFEVVDSVLVKVEEDL